MVFVFKFNKIILIWLRHIRCDRVDCARAHIQRLPRGNVERHLAGSRKWRVIIIKWHLNGTRLRRISYHQRHIERIGVTLANTSLDQNWCPLSAFKSKQIDEIGGRMWTMARPFSPHYWRYWDLSIYLHKLLFYKFIIVHIPATHLKWTTFKSNK